MFTRTSIEVDMACLNIYWKLMWKPPVMILSKYLVWCDAANIHFDLMYDSYVPEVEQK